MLRLKIIVGSTRAARKSPLVADWILEKTLAYKKFEVELLDLAKIKLPFLDEPEMANLQHYQHAHTKRWSKKIKEADAILLVTPEYNNSFPAPVKNALDFLYNEWNAKPIAFVSYGGVSGGTRSVLMLKQVVAALKMYAVKEAVNIPFFEKHIKRGKFTGDVLLNKSAAGMLKELEKWAIGLKKIRETA